MMFSFVFLMLLLGAGAVALGLIVFAIVSKKLWVIPVAGGLVFLGLIACGLLGALYSTAAHRTVSVQMQAPSQVFDEVNGMSYPVAHGPPNFNSYSSGNGSVFVSGSHWSR